MNICGRSGDHDDLGSRLRDSLRTDSSGDSGATASEPSYGFGLKCNGCGHFVMMPRVKFEKMAKAIVTEE